MKEQNGTGEFVVGDNDEDKKKLRRIGLYI